MRPQNEFIYGGDATVKRPELNKEVSDKEWDTFVYFRKSPRGKHTELWQHICGCRRCPNLNQIPVQPSRDSEQKVQP